MHSEEELRLVVSASQSAAGGTAAGRNIILNALDLRHRTVREIMRPRHEIIAFDTGAPIAECLALVEKKSLFALSDLRGRRPGQDARRPSTSRIFMRCAIRRGRRQTCCLWRGN